MLDSHPLGQRRTVKASNVARRENARTTGVQPLVNHNSSLYRQPCGTCELRRRLDADPGNDPTRKDLAGR